MRTSPTLLSRTSLYFSRILLLASTLLTIGTTNSCSQQGQNKETTGSSAETDSTEARQLAQEETFLANKAKEPGVKSLVVDYFIKCYTLAMEPNPPQQVQ